MEIDNQLNGCSELFEKALSNLVSVLDDRSFIFWEKIVALVCDCLGDVFRIFTA